MGELLGWDGAAKAAEVESYREFARRETRAIGEAAVQFTPADHAAVG
jgi:hypothetical protein